MRTSHVRKLSSRRNAAIGGCGKMRLVAGSSVASHADVLRLGVVCNQFEIVKQDSMYSSVQRMVCEYQRTPGHLFFRRIAFGNCLALRQVFHFLEAMFQSLCAVAESLKERGHLLGFV